MEGGLALMNHVGGVRAFGVLPLNAGGYYTSPVVQPAPQPMQPVPDGLPATPNRGGSGSPLWLLDLGQMLVNPVRTIKDLFALSGAVTSLSFKPAVSLASAGPSLAEYQAARGRLEQSTFRHALPIFEGLLNRWAMKTAITVKPEVELGLSAAAWHPVRMEWPDGGTGHQALSELLAVQNLLGSLGEAAWVRGLLGANRIQFKDSSLMDYFYPVSREGDALLLRRPLPLIPGQATLEQNLRAYLSQTTNVGVQVMPPAPF
jgi:hypothetical protein